MVVYKINNKHWVAGKYKREIIKWYKQEYSDVEIEEIERVNIHTEGLYISATNLTESELNNDVKLFRKFDNNIVCLLTFDTILSKTDREDCYLVGSMPEQEEQPIE